MRVLKENIIENQAIDAEVLTLGQCCTLARKVEIWQTQKLLCLPG